MIDLYALAGDELDNKRLKWRALGESANGADEVVMRHEVVWAVM
jgi:hypothetical protein